MVPFSGAVDGCSFRLPFFVWVGFVFLLVLFLCAILCMGSFCWIRVPDIVPDVVRFSGVVFGCCFVVPFLGAVHGCRFAGAVPGCHSRVPFPGAVPGCRSRKTRRDSAESEGSVHHLS